MSNHTSLGLSHNLREAGFKKKTTYFCYFAHVNLGVPSYNIQDICTKYKKEIFGDNCDEKAKKVLEMIDDGIKEYHYEKYLWENCVLNKKLK